MLPFVLFIYFSSCVYSVGAFYIPGIAPTLYKYGDDVQIRAVKVTSEVTQLPYSYYNLGFCKPSTPIEYHSLNLGEILRGDRISNTPYIVKGLTNSTCQILCQTNYDDLGASQWIFYISKFYMVHLQADNLPLHMRLTKATKNGGFKQLGYPIGTVAGRSYYLNNHITFKFYYTKEDLGNGRIVGFEGVPSSRNYATGDVRESCLHNKGFDPLELYKYKSGTIQYTYDVMWYPSDTSWTSRWDVYLSSSNTQIHWFSIFNSIVVVFFLSGILAIVIVRTLHKDIDHYNKNVENMSDELDECGWKLVHGDVFRSPKYPLMFSVMIGSGVQVTMMLLIIIFFAMIGILSPASRGTLLSAGIFIFVLMGIFAGYSAGRLYKTFKGQRWKTAAFYTSFFSPGVIWFICFGLNIFIWAAQSSAALPVGTVFALLFLWLCVSLPLVYIGTYFGYRKQPYQHPVRVNQIPRAIPPQKWYLKIIASSLIAGVMPFGAVFIELFFIYASLWEMEYYYLFGFLFLVFLIVMVSCSQISIVFVYFRLCAEDYHWWWKSYISSMGSAVYVFFYTLFYYFHKSEIYGFVPTMVYFGYSSIIVFIFGSFTGTIGFYSAYWFVRRIYGAIKID